MHRARSYLLLMSLVMTASIGVAQTPFLYAIDAGTRSLYWIDPSSLIAAKADNLPFANGIGGLTSDGTELYAIEYGPLVTPQPPSQIWKLARGDQGSVPLTTLGPPSIIDDLARHPTNGSYYTVTVWLGIITFLTHIPVSGNPVHINPTAPIGLWVESIGFDSLGNLWGCRSGPSPTVGGFNLTTGDWVDFYSLSTSMSGMAFIPGTSMFYAVTSNAPRRLVLFDVLTGVETSLGVINAPTPFFPRGLACPLSTPVSAVALTFGSPCGPTLGSPTLVTNGPPRFGDPNFAVSVLGAPPGATAYWYLASTVQPIGIPLRNGCFIHLEPTSLQALTNLGFNPVLTTPTDATGTATVALPLLNHPIGSGWDLATQVAVVDPLATGGFSVTPALSLTFGL